MSCWAAPFLVPLVYPTLQKNERIAAPGASQIRFQLFLSRAHPRCVVLLGNSHALVDEKKNLVTVKRKNGEQVSYDPRRLHGVTLYRETERAFSEGDRVQFTAPNRERHIANRELGTIEKIDDSDNLQLRLDSGRTIAFNIKDNRHLDYG